MVNSSLQYNTMMPKFQTSTYSSGGAGGYHNSSAYFPPYTTNTLNNTSLQYNVETTPFSLRDNRSQRDQGNMSSHNNIQSQRDSSFQRRFQHNLSSVQINDNSQAAPGTMTLTQENLEILNKQHCPSKDMLYAKIFTDFENDSNVTPVKRQAGYSAQLLTPQSLFCFAYGARDDTEDLLAKRRRIMGNKEFESAKILGAKLRRKSLTKFVEK